MESEFDVPPVPLRPVVHLTRGWGDWDQVSLYLDRCQVDTPHPLVAATWEHVLAVRRSVGKVVDFGAGDGRFATGGRYEDYIGYEVDADRSSPRRGLPINAHIVNSCAFSQEIADADLCIGNPPFVRNQDLPTGWREHASAILEQRTGVQISGLANAWQYFFLLGLASVKEGGLVALVIPFEWVSRPSAKALRAYIHAKRWGVSVYRLVDETFRSVATTASITIVDKADKSGAWRYFEETALGKYQELPSPSGSVQGVIPYSTKLEAAGAPIRAVRGLSPGTQKVLTLTEGERTRYGLHKRRDVVPCVTTLRHFPSGSPLLDKGTFAEHYVSAGKKCWLIRTDREPSPALATYLAAVPEADYHTSTCLEREVWWKFVMPPVPDLLVATGFKRASPKVVRNTLGVRAVGGVCGIYGAGEEEGRVLGAALASPAFIERIVPHSNGLRKIEINQLNTLLRELFARTPKAA